MRILKGTVLGHPETTRSRLAAFTGLTVFIGCLATFFAYGICLATPPVCRASPVNPSSSSLSTAAGRRSPYVLALAAATLTLLL